MGMYFLVLDRVTWAPILPLKISFFTWCLLRNFLPLDVNIQHRGVALGSRCFCCYGVKESIDHLFVIGVVATQVWRHFQGCLQLLEGIG